MHSPFQHHLRDPSSIRWEQAAYASLSTMTASAAVLRRMQAAKSFESGQWRRSVSIAPYRWATAYLKLAEHLCYAKYEYAFNDGSIDVEHSIFGLNPRPVGNIPSNTYTLDIQGLSVLAKIQRLPLQRFKPDSFLESHFGRIVQALGMEDPLTRGMLCANWTGEAQIQAWRRYFPHDPLHSILGIALENQRLPSMDLDNYCLLRRSIQRAQQRGLPALELPEHVMGLSG